MNDAVRNLLSELYTMIRKYSINEKKASDICAGLLGGLFVYAAISKLASYEKSRKEMLNQVFPHEVAILLTWLIPTTELVIAIMLLFPRLRKLSFLLSFALLLIFSIYIAVSMSGTFGRIPCSCGGVLGQMSYSAHLIFNLFFIILAAIGIKSADQISNGKISRYKPKRKEDHRQIV
jgi:uncharacterized membrane protein YphA (DoxX/SURF4 family)